MVIGNGEIDENIGAYLAHTGITLLSWNLESTVLKGYKDAGGYPLLTIEQNREESNEDLNKRIDGYDASIYIFRNYSIQP